MIYHTESFQIFLFGKLKYQEW